MKIILDNKQEVQVPEKYADEIKDIAKEIVMQVFFENPSVPVKTVRATPVRGKAVNPYNKWTPEEDAAMVMDFKNKPPFQSALQWSKIYAPTHGRTWRAIYGRVLNS